MTSKKGQLMINEAFKTRYFWHIAIGLLALAMFIIHPAKAYSKNAFLEGTATYRERMALPPKATLEVRLVETTKNSSRGKTVAHLSERIRSGVPIKFLLKYNDRDIRRGYQYVLQADIKVDGKVWFTTTGRYPVLSRNHNANLVLQRVNIEDKKTGQNEVFGNWTAVSLNGQRIAGKSDVKMQLTKNGEITGFSGCNRYFGQVRLRNNMFKTSQVGSTRMACHNQKIVMQERALFDVLEKASSYRLAKGGKELNLRDQRGRTIAVFIR